jgi:hypothetical protein
LKDATKQYGRHGAALPLALGLAVLLAACGGRGGEPAGSADAESDASSSGTGVDARGATTVVEDAASASRDGATGVPVEDSATQAAGAPPQEPGRTMGGDGSEIVLAPLTETDLADIVLEGELACAFATEGGAPLLLARGDAASQDAARGAVKVGGYVEPVGAPGGFDGMLDGASFAGQGKTVTVEVTGPASGSGESPPRPATLTYQRADGAERTWNGEWTCGP